jgi:hypothetical protein
MAEEAQRAQTVLIVDDDLGFVWWLGDIFTEVGGRALPALSCDEAVVLTKRFGVEPDLIILNPSLPGASKMLQNYVQKKPHLKIVTLGPPSKKALDTSIHIHATLERPSPRGPILRTEWLEKLRKVLGQSLRASRRSTGKNASIC